MNDLDYKKILTDLMGTIRVLDRREELVDLSFEDSLRTAEKAVNVYLCQKELIGAEECRCDLCFDDMVSAAENAYDAMKESGMA